MVLGEDQAEDQSASTKKLAKHYQCSGLLTKTSSPLPLGFSPCYSQVCDLASLVPMFFQN